MRLERRLASSSCNYPIDGGVGVSRRCCCCAVNVTPALLRKKKEEREKTKPKTDQKQTKNEPKACGEVSLQHG